MSTIEQSVIINRTVEEIYRFFSSAENHAQFIPGMREVKQTSPGSFAQVGATARGMRRDMVIDSEVLYEITQVEPNKVLGMKGIMGPIHFDDGYILEPMGSATRVRFWLDLKLPGILKIGNPFMQIVGKTHAWETLANLKRVLEGGKVTG